MRYTEDERAEQVAAVHALVRSGATHRQIQDQTGLSLATIHERRREAAGLADQADLESATAVRREAGTTARSWLARVEDGYAAGAVDPLLASREAHRWTTLLAKLFGAYAPIRVDVQAGVDLTVAGAHPMWDTIQESLDQDARAFADRFAQAWGLPDDAADQLYARLAPWREEDDLAAVPDRADGSLITTPGELRFRRSGARIGPKNLGPTP